MERTVWTKQGKASKDTGVRENSRGAMYVDKKILLSKDKVKNDIERAIKLVK